MPCILVIDDRKDNLIAIEALLDHLIPNCRVITAQSGIEGIAVTAAEMPDTILLDVQMPVMNGYEVCKKLKTDDSTRHIPIIMVTAIDTDTQSRIKGLDMGADAFISKPIDEEELAAQVNVMLRIKKSRGKLEAEKEDLEEREQERTHALRESEEKLRLLFDGTHDLISLTDADSRAIWANPAWKKVFGSGLENQPNHFSLVHPDDMERVSANWDLVVSAHGRMKNLEYRIRTPRGKYKVLETTVHPVTISGQSLYYLIAHDISDRKQVEEALKRSEERYRSLMDVMTSVVWSVDAEGKVIAPQNSWEKYTGMTWREYRSFGWMKAFHNDDRVRLAAEWSAAIAGVRFFECEGRVWCTDADEFHYVQARAVPILNNDNSVREWVGTVSDVHDRKLAEKTLLESEERYRTITENSPDVILRFDKQLRHTYVSPNIKSLFGINHDDYIGKTFSDLGYPENVCRSCEEAVTDTFQTGREQELEYEFEMAQGSMFVSLRLKPEFADLPDNADESAIVESVIGVSRDITERKRLEEQLRQAQKMEAIGTLAGGIAHDFNNILGIIQGYAELTVEETAPGSVAHENLTQVLAAANRAGELVKQILAFSRKTEKGKRPLYVSQIAEEVLKMIRSTLPSTIQITSHITQKSGLIIGNPTQIHQVIMNLCVNAGHAMRESGGTLHIALKEIRLEVDNFSSTLTSGDYLQLSVTDTGHGMTAEVMDRIFEPYFTTKKTGEGTGMGLSVVHGIVKSHGGEIAVTSEPVKGTTFDIYLPLTKNSPASGVKTQTQTNGGCEHILFVDDERDLVEMGKQMLEKMGYQVTISTSSIEALEIFNNSPLQFDLVITDQTMPLMTGTQLTRELLQIRPDIPVLLCTGFSESVNKENFRNMGIGSFIMKPIIKKELAHIIRELLAEAQASKTSLTTRPSE